MTAQWTVFLQLWCSISFLSLFTNDIHHLSLVDIVYHNILYFALDWHCKLITIMVTKKEEWFFIADVAKEARVSPRTLLRWGDSGKIPRPKKLKANGRLVFGREDREAILTFANAIEST